MPDPLPGYDDWKLSNGPYENDGEPDEPDEEPSDDDDNPRFRYYDPLIGPYENDAEPDEEPSDDYV